MKKILLSLIGCILFTISFAQFINFTKEDKQAVRLDNLGNAVDAHDGMLAYFNGTYYLYGTSYNCGFEWQNKNAAFCGFKVYSSKDLKNWKDEGFLFNAETDTWQCRCNGNTYGCFRPHVVYNKKTGQYVLWINSYDNSPGFHVFTSSNPVGPFKEAAEPKLVVNDGVPAGLNNGDHDVFVDDDGAAYLALTDWRAGGAIAIEKLTDDYLTGTGDCVRSVTDRATEAPGLFKRKGVYYMLYSDPNCGYCGGTGTSYKTAPSPLGPWSNAKKISDNSCGGQPSFAVALPYKSDTLYIYGSDLWNNSARNEALANYFWTPLSFDEQGDIMPIDCSNKTIDQSAKSTSNEKYYSLKQDISKGTKRAQSFTAKKKGTLNKIEIPLFKNNHPNANLVFELYKANGNFLPQGASLYKKEIDSNLLGWSARNLVVYPKIRVKKNENYVFVLRSDATQGCYGFLYNFSEAGFDEKESVSKDEGSTYIKEAHYKLKYQLSIGSFKQN